MDAVVLGDRLPEVTQKPFLSPGSLSLQCRHWESLKVLWRWAYCEMLSQYPQSAFQVSSGGWRGEGGGQQQFATQTLRVEELCWGGVVGIGEPWMCVCVCVGGWGVGAEYSCRAEFWGWGWGSKSDPHKKPKLVSLPLNNITHIEKYLGELLFGSSYSCHVIRCASRSYTWKPFFQ